MIAATCLGQKIRISYLAVIPYIGKAEGTKRGFWFIAENGLISSATEVWPEFWGKGGLFF